MYITPDYLPFTATSLAWALSINTGVGCLGLLAFGFLQAHPNRFTARLLRPRALLQTLLAAQRERDAELGSPHAESPQPQPPPAVAPAPRVSQGSAAPPGPQQLRRLRSMTEDKPQRRLPALPARGWIQFLLAIPGASARTRGSQLPPLPE